MNAENDVIDRRLGGIITQSLGTPEQTFDEPRTLTAFLSAYVHS